MTSAPVTVQALASAAADAGRKTAAYVPAPPKVSVVYDGGAGYDPGSTNATSVGQYADTNTNTVHTTRGFSKRQIAQDVGQLFAAQVLSPGDRHYFSRILGTDPNRWDNLHGAQPGNPAGTEAFSNYYAVAATGGLKPGESLLMGDTPIDPQKLGTFRAALARIARRRNLQPYKP